MIHQLSIECDVINQSNYNDTLKDYEKKIKQKDLHPVYLLFSKVRQEYFVSTLFKPELWIDMNKIVVVK